MKRFIHVLFTVVLFVASTFLLASTPAKAEWFDRSHSIFLPPAMNAKLGATQTFPLLWWNFLVIEGVADHPEKATPICRAFQNDVASPLAKISCEGDLDTFLPLLREWSRDYPLRHPYPGDRELTRKIKETFAEASLPMGPGLLRILREDPFGSAAEFRKTFEAQLKMDLPNRGGVFVDSATNRLIIPVQFKTPPSDTSATVRFYQILGKACGGDPCPAATLIGPHASTFANEQQVQHDLEYVSLLGFFLTGFQVVFLLLSGRARALLLFPPVFLATGFAAAVTVFVFGSIHGLTLAFGTGLIGLAIDYGLHSAFNLSYRGVWRANFCGILTTLAGFGVMLASEIPLLRQLMFFALVGLVTTYLLFYFLHHFFGKTFAIEPFNYVPKARPWQTVAVFAILAAAIPAAFLLRPNLNMAQFDFQSAHETEIRNWLYPHLGVKSSLLDLNREMDFSSALATAHLKQNWADQNAIGYQSIARFIPTIAESTANRWSWISVLCAKKGKGPIGSLSPAIRQFFAPAFSRLECDALSEIGKTVPNYVQDFRGAPSIGKRENPGTLAVWLPSNGAEIAKIKAVYPNALSLREVVDIFPQTLSAELRWMAPLSIFLATLILFIYYRRIWPTLLALVPFFCATGVYSLGVLAFRLNFSFISLIALLMVFGFSIDYGVFAVDVELEPEGRSVTGVWTCLLFASGATGLGFVPLLICRHPVLAHLGQTLTLGTIGTAIGTLWGIPGISRLLRLRKGRTS